MNMTSRFYNLRLGLGGLVLAASLLPQAVRAQDESSAGDTEELNVIEVELEKNSKPAPAISEQEEKSSAAVDNKPIDFSGLGRLAPFTEVSVIQRRYLPKTGRFQLFGGLTMVTNDPFYNVFGGVAKAGYFFTESIGLEFSYTALSTNEAKATTELRKIQGVQTDSLVYTKSVATADLMFVPVYGKMTWGNDRIVPFDLYFSLGYGATQTQNQSPGTLHLATGQMFALSKATAFRWDFSWNFFSAEGINQKKDSYNNLFLTVGWSWFFPEAKYR